MLDFSNITFLIPFSNNVPQRLNNLKYILYFFEQQEYLSQCNFMICESVYQSTQSVTTDLLKNFNLNIRYFLIQQEDVYFNKCKCLNIMLNKSTTEYVVAHDVDCICAEIQYIQAYEKLLTRTVSIVHPFNQHVINIPIKNGDEIYAHYADLKWFNRYPPWQHKILAPGGSVFMHKEDYLIAGAENEMFKGYAPEDTERNVRFEKMGFKAARIAGEIYHFMHDRTITASESNPLKVRNMLIYSKVLGMNKIQLENSIKIKFKNL